MKLKKILISKSFYLFFFISSSLLVASTNIFSIEKKNNGLPNIIIFLADDANWNDFGSYGNNVIQTPTINKLAEDGLTVKKAFLMVGQCSPSRISLLTGMYPHATKAEDLHMPMPEHLQIVPSFLQEKGYFTGHMKKTHYGPHADAQFNWYNERTADSFPEFLDAADEDPFFLWVGFTEPHRSYPSSDNVKQLHDPANVKVPPYLVDDEATRGDLAMYYDEIAHMDIKIGRFMEELRSRNVEENTMVIFISDNGMPFPRAKGTVYDEGVRTPLIITWPKQINAGATYDGLVSLVDLAPTILDIAGIPSGENMQGESFAEMLFDQSVSGREYLFIQRNWHDADEHIRAVRSENHLLVRNAYVELPHGTPADIGGSPSFRSLVEKRENGELTTEQARLFEVPRPIIEFYDVKDDPYQLNNLASHDDYWQLARDYARILENWMEETNDFPPYYRTRADHTDRWTGVRFQQSIPPMRNAEIENE
ncbi:sulfatase [soil metagenome]